MIAKLLKPLSFLPAIILMYIIFSFSAQDGTASSEISFQVSYKIVEAGSIVLNVDLEPSEISVWAERIEGVVRKLAHMTEYFALAIAVAFPLYVYGLHGIPLMLIAGFICVAFACSDEYHQSFVSGRSPSPRDVLIDSFGVFWGIILVRIIGWTGRKTIFRPFTKKKRRKNEYDETAASDAYQYQYASGSSSVYPPPVQNRQRTPGGGGTAGYGAGYANVPPDYPNRPYNGTAGAPSSGPSATSGKRRRVSSSDSLSEDMSLKKLLKSFRSKKRDEDGA